MRQPNPRRAALRTALFTVPWLLLALVAVSSATYAWFTANRVVTTDTARARTAEDQLELQLSAAGGEDFLPMAEAPITQVNDYSATGLLPVSTADLISFVYSPAVTDEGTVGFLPVEGESRYYHGRFYLRAMGQGGEEGSHLDLYLDDSGADVRLLSPEPESLLLNAARLGLLFDGEDAVILRLSEAGNGAAAQIRNTVLNGEPLPEGWVLSGADSGAPDPSLPLAEVSVGASGLPSRPLASLELGRIYTVDVYFYLEGCDPDCSSSVARSGAELRLAFYGALVEAAA